MLRLAIKKIPLSLAALLTATALIGTAWAFLDPPWQSPDESDHFGYTQVLGERLELPGDSDRSPFSTEQRLAGDRSNSDQTAAVLATKPEWSKQAYERWKKEEDALPADNRGDGGGPNPASTNPPLYYLYESLPYRAAIGGDIFARFYLMRLWSVALLLLTTTATWLLAGELFGRQRRLQLVAAAVAGLVPMVSFITASVNPDGLLFALWSLAFWLGARILRRGLSMSDVVALFAVVGLAVTTKATGYALLPAALLVLTVGAVRLRRRGGGKVMVTCAALAFALPAGGWLTTAAALDRPAVNQVAASSTRAAPSITSFNPREFGSYLWQFYLPRLPSQEPIEGMPKLPAYSIWTKQGWANFGWLEIKFPAPVYVVLALVSLFVLGAASAGLVKHRRQIDPALAAFFALAALTLLAGLHWTEFRTLVGGAGPFNQGRYLLPLISLFGALTAAAVTLAPERRRGLAIGTLLGGLFALQLFSLAIVGARFYA